MSHLERKGKVKVNCAKRNSTKIAIYIRVYEVKLSRVFNLEKDQLSFNQVFRDTSSGVLEVSNACYTKANKEQRVKLELMLTS